MILDVALMPAVVTGLVVVVPLTGRALHRLLKTIEHLRQERTVVEVVREQRQMAELSLRNGTEMSHSVEGGARLVIRQLPAGQSTKDVTK